MAADGCRRGRRKSTLGRAKSCLWQVFVRRRPPKQGELRTDVSKATMFQGDRAAKGFKFVCVKLFFGWADSRFGKPRISFLEGFNFVRAKPPLRRAESRFAEPRDFPERVRFYSFRLYEKNQKYPRGLRTSGLRGGFKALSKKILAELPAVRVEPGFSHKTAAKRL